MTYLTFIFLIVFLPGMTWESIDKNFASKAKPDKFEFILRSAVFGVISYICVSLVNYGLGYALPIHAFEAELKYPEEIKDAFLTLQNITFIAEAEILAVFLGIIWVFTKNCERYTRLLRWIDQKRYYGPYDVWDRVLNESLTAKTKPYVVVRDMADQITYEGVVQYFTETDVTREIVLIDALIRHEEKGSMEIEKLYLSLDPQKIIMDVMSIEKDTKKEALPEEGKE